MRIRFISVTIRPRTSWRRSEDLMSIRNLIFVSGTSSLRRSKVKRFDAGGVAKPRIRSASRAKRSPARFASS